MQSVSFDKCIVRNAVIEMMCDEPQNNEEEETVYRERSGVTDVADDLEHDDLEVTGAPVLLRRRNSKKRKGSFVKKMVVEKADTSIDTQMSNRDISGKLIETLLLLRETLAENTAALERVGQAQLQPIKEQVKYHPATARQREQTMVEMKVEFLRVIDVDTVSQLFSADVLIQAKWEEPDLDQMTQEELDKADLNVYWDPEITVTNVEGDVDDNIVTLTAAEEEPGYDHAIMIYRRRLRGKFKEILELKHFPVDVQELTLSVSCEKSSDEVDLVEDRHHLSKVNTYSFQDEQAWSIYEHVEVVKRKPQQGVINARYKNPTLDFMCHVARKPNFYVWNVIFLMFLISSLTFASYSIDLELPQNRLDVTLTLLLTTVAFKFVVAQNLPTLSYLTYLDIYVLACMVFTCLQAVQNAVISKALKLEGGKTYSKFIDRYSLGATAILALLANVFFVIYIWFAVRKRRRKMKQLDMEYRIKKNLRLRHAVLGTFSLGRNKIWPQEGQLESNHAGGHDEDRSSLV